MGAVHLQGIKEEEPEQFNEPGVFFIRPDGTVFLEALNSMAFARPPLDELRDGVDFVIESDYPARGEA